jgi:hypothetical protein
MTREFFYKLWFWFKSILELLQKFQIKTEKRKDLKNRKGPQGKALAQARKTAHGPPGVPD